MAKRYAFFRTPTGQPHRGEDGRYAPDNLLAEVGSTASLNPEGQPQWSGFSFRRWQTALRSALVVIGPEEREMNEADVNDILWRAIITTVKRAPGKPVKSVELIGELDQLAAAYYRRPDTAYVLVTSLSIGKFPAKSLHVGQSTVSPLKKRGTRYPLPQVLSSLAHRSAFSKHLTTSQYQLVKLTTRGRTIHEGIDNALSDLHLLRGLWSLFATYGTWRLSFGSPNRKPLGVIHTGPVYTLHLLDGRAADDRFYWYDPDYTEDRPLFKDDESWERIEKNRRWTMKRLKASNHRQEILDLLIRYAGALDQLNPNLAFLEMWSILEKITDTVGGNYDETIRRTTWVYATYERPIARELLAALRNRRNQYVHAGKGGIDADQIAYLIKSFIDPHLLYLIKNPFKVSSLNEYGQILSLPTDIAIIEKQKQRLSRALRTLVQEKRQK